MFDKNINSTRCPFNVKFGVCMSTMLNVGCSFCQVVTLVVTS